jgi:hypothetical protein
MFWNQICEEKAQCIGYFEIESLKLLKLVKFSDHFIFNKFFHESNIRIS